MGNKLLRCQLELKVQIWGNFPHYMLERFLEQQRLEKSMLVITRPGKQMFHWPLLYAFGLSICQHAWVDQKGTTNKVCSPETQVNKQINKNQILNVCFRKICKRNSKAYETTSCTHALLLKMRKDSSDFIMTLSRRNWKLWLWLELSVKRELGGLDFLPNTDIPLYQGNLLLLTTKH